MKDNVYINIKGLQLTPDTGEEPESEDEDVIEIINAGKYNVINGKEYVKYDEVIEGEKQKNSCMLKIDRNNNTVEITKKGPVTVHMSFVQNEKTMTYYDTPYGSIYLGIFSRNVNIEDKEDRINISIDYSLELNYEQVSDCKVDIEITPKGQLKL